MRVKFDPTRYTRSQLMVPQEEDAVVAEIVGWLFQTYRIRAIVLDSGAKKLRGRAMGALARSGAGRAVMDAVNKGQTGAGANGLSDLVFHLPGGRAAWVEVKRRAWIPDKKIERPSGKPSTEQVDFLVAREAEGCLATVAWGYQDVADLILGAIGPNIKPLPASNVKRSE